MPNFMPPRALGSGRTSWWYGCIMAITCGSHARGHIWLLCTYMAITPLCVPTRSKLKLHIQKALPSMFAVVVKELFVIPGFSALMKGCRDILILAVLQNRSGRKSQFTFFDKVSDSKDYQMGVKTESIIGLAVKMSKK